ncbi:MAG: inorganic phosphate transporter, partial [Candidatus Aminicenantes bacterium]|nr:inorganic phosphate transporter [Candidatus Aminicenantes bacterium]
MLAFVILIISIALLFDFLNGMNDAANSVATVVSTRVLSPRLAVIWAAAFNFLAAFFFGVHVARTIGMGVIDPSIISPVLILIALISAVLWTHFCTKAGLPISVSHALIGGLIGSGIAKAGFQALVVSGVLKICLFIVLSPLIGFLLAMVIMVVVYRVCRHSNLRKIDVWFRRLQLVSAGFYSLAHGTNDAQKTMGVVSVLLYSTGYLGKTFYVPFWVIISCYLAIAMGTLAGGWKVIETLGMKMTKLKPVHGFSAETASAAAIIFASLMGAPVS